MDTDAALYAKARMEMALLALALPQGVSGIVAGVWSDTGWGPKVVMGMLLAWMMLGPGLLLRGPLRDRPRVGIAVTVAMSVLAVLVATWSPLLTLALGAVALAASMAFYRIIAATSYRPRLMRTPQ
jgi:hypothetical protein